MMMCCCVEVFFFWKRSRVSYLFIHWLRIKQKKRDTYYWDSLIRSSSFPLQPRNKKKTSTQQHIMTKKTELSWQTASYFAALMVVFNVLWVMPPPSSLLSPPLSDMLNEECSGDLLFPHDQKNTTNTQTADATNIGSGKTLVELLDAAQYVVLKLGREYRWWIVALVAVSPLLVSVYKYFFLPLRVVMSLEDVEMKAEGAKYRGRRPRRARGDLPPAYPNAWYKVMCSHEIQRGEAQDVEMLGKHFVVFRGKDDGKVRILDAYCPHMGANLGVGGTVIGNEIACPFHGWQFDGQGSCTNVPYADNVPTLPSKIQTHTCTEVNNAIFIWHDAEGREPQWHVPEIKGVSDGSWYHHGDSSHTVRAHLQEIPENGADTAHLNYLHVPFVIPIPLIDVFFTHYWDATWEPGTGIESHLAHIHVRHGVKLFGWKIPNSEIDVNITQVGPSIVHLTFNTPVGRVLIVETVTPVQALLQRATHQGWGEWRVPRFAAKVVLKATLDQFEKDVPIWNNKTFVRPPQVVKQDGPIAKYRRWFQKNFYSENSERVAREREEAVAGPLDW
eukprot:TRINITY_DN967_c0_g1_i2.p1 TRINITY_DN967_c0_g1~~TRINITY_DN967_c0_g1_i2.p1  ORF type:complete len:558 (-),score=66.63 TRINITY_DN967_c0_g1_i2:156-1829(-)